MTGIEVVLDDAPSGPPAPRDRRGLLIAGGVLLAAVVGVAVAASTPTDSAAAGVLAQAASTVSLGGDDTAVVMTVVDAAGTATSVEVTSAGTRSVADAAEPVPVGALGEMLTAAATMRLVEDGRLDVEAPVARYLPDRAPPGVTVRHLMQHTSGLPELTTEPGSAVRHAAENEVLLREVVAAAAGRDFADVLRAEVLGPARLQATSLTPGDATRAEMLSSPADLARLLRALHDGTLLSPPTRAAMTDRLADVTGGGAVQVGLGLLRFPGYGPLVGSYSTGDGRSLLVMHAPDTQRTGVWSSSGRGDVTGTLRTVAEHLLR